MNNFSQITWSELSKILDVDLGIVPSIHSGLINYKNLTDYEITEEFNKQLLQLNFNSNQIVGEHRKKTWELGWKQVFDKLQNDGYSQDVLYPGYYRGEKLFRFNGRLVEGLVGNEDRDLQNRIIDLMVANLVSRVNVNSIHEFGCGTGMHLIRWHKLFGNHLSYHGYDWAISSQDILNALCEKGLLNVSSSNYNFFDPSPLNQVDDKSLVITITALEQIGGGYLPFLLRLLESPAARFVHFEPFFEEFDPLDPFDKTSIYYCNSRNYLRGFLEHLRQLEKENAVKIVKYKRTKCGSRLHEGATYLEWKKI